MNLINLEEARLAKSRRAWRSYRVLSKIWRRSSGIGAQMAHAPATATIIATTVPPAIRVCDISIYNHRLQIGMLEKEYGK